MPTVARRVQTKRVRGRTTRPTYGPCMFYDLCGNDASYRECGLCQACYSSCRLWKNAKSTEERAIRRVRLHLFSQRMDNVESGLVRIGGVNKYELKNKKKTKKKKRSR